MNYKRIIIILAVAGVVAIILGTTFAFWRWQSTSAQNTSITFTTGANFSCSADGGGNITNRDYFAPTDCTNSTYAVQRTITTNITNNSSDEVYLSMWLNVNEIDEYLGDTENFKYALTTSQNSCTTNVISEGNFYGIESGDTIPLLNEATRGSTYYLYIWLDSAETNNETQYNWVDISLGGECTNNGPNYTYAIDLLGGSDNNRYQTPAAAMTALKTAGGGSVEHPIFLRYRTVPVWLDDYHNAYYTEDECLQSTHNDGCPESTHIVETYVGFVVSPELAADNQGMTAGTYYLRDGYDNNADDPSHAPSLYYEDNEEIMTTAFGSNNCQYLDNGNYYYCAILNDLSVSISSLGGEINVSDTKGANCGTNLGSAHCSVSAP